MRLQSWSEYSMKQTWKDNEAAFSWAVFGARLASALGDYVTFWNLLDLVSLGMLWVLVYIVANAGHRLDVMDMLASTASLLLVIRSYEWLAGFQRFAHLIRTILQILTATATFMIVLIMMLVARRIRTLVLLLVCARQGPNRGKLHGAWQLDSAGTSGHEHDFGRRRTRT